MKINVAELLKDCPKGMELNCTMYDNVTLDSVDSRENVTFPIRALRTDGNFITFTKYGQYADASWAKCVIFPKGKTTWEGFIPPRKFKDGDIIYNQCIKAVAIFCKQTDDSTISHCFLNKWKELKIRYKHCKLLSDWRLATEEEKQKLFQAIKDNGYRWNAETKTLESLVGPKFNIGDCITHLKLNHVVYTVTCITDTHYIVKSDGIYAYEYHIPISSQDYYEKVRLKFNYNTLVPFESKVLIRHDKEDKWMPSFWGYKTDNGYITTFGWWKYCIPYEGNEHLLGTTNDCDEYYKNW